MESEILRFSQVWMKSPSLFPALKTWECYISGSFRLFERTMHMHFPKFWAMYLQAGNKLGNGRDMMQKQSMTRILQKCSVYIGLMDYREILQRDFNKGYAADFFDFPKFEMEFPSSFPTFENLGCLYLGAL